MELIIIGIFWLSILLLIHAYVLYPISIKFLTLFQKKGKSENDNYFPAVSILISAYNEEKVIKERIENIKNLRYDFNKVELIIGSDSSSDKTNEILKRESQNYEWIKVQFFETRRGKAGVLNDLVKLTNNEILIFTDANTKFEKDALLKLVAGFANKETGGVCGRLVLEEPKENFDSTNKEKLYWIYETQLKKIEGELGILIAANGGIYAIRKKLFNKFPVDVAITDDLYQTLSVLKQGYKFLYEFDAVANEDISKEIITEFRRKVRFAATNFQTLKFFKELLFNKKVLLSYALWSHKVIRWFVPIILIIIFVTGIVLSADRNFYFFAFLLQAGFYVASLIGYVFNKFKINISFFSLIYYYVLTNLALLIGLIKFLSRKQVYTWDSTPR